MERHTLIPADLGITDFGPLPRERYPLVSVLTVAEATDIYNIVRYFGVLRPVSMTLRYLRSATVYM